MQLDLTVDMRCADMYQGQSDIACCAKYKYRRTRAPETAPCGQGFWRSMRRGRRCVCEVVAGGMGVAGWAGVVSQVAGCGRIDALGDVAVRAGLMRR